MLTTGHLAMHDLAPDWSDIPLTDRSDVLDAETDIITAILSGNLHVEPCWTWDGRLTAYGLFEASLQAAS